mmetsp:Transcript_70818/g.224170  ORF Transcript_70818/g.224170 Transcript_70818/m.224170 type:complete len:258 (-) Transcript_70818:457-1230(-)
MCKRPRLCTALSLCCACRPCPSPPSFKFYKNLLESTRNHPIHTLLRGTLLTPSMPPLLYHTPLLSTWWLLRTICCWALRKLSSCSPLRSCPAILSSTSRSHSSPLAASPLAATRALPATWKSKIAAPHTSSPMGPMQISPQPLSRHSITMALASALRMGDLWSMRPSNTIPPAAPPESKHILKHTLSSSTYPSASSNSRIVTPCPPTTKLCPPLLTTSDSPRARLCETTMKSPSSQPRMPTTRLLSLVLRAEPTESR